MVVERLETLRTGGIEPVQGEAMAVLNKDARESQRHFRGFNELYQRSRSDPLHGRYSEEKKRQDKEQNAASKSPSICLVICQAPSSASWCAT